VQNSASPPPVEGRTAHGGFTLLEILLAIFLFAILVTTVFGAFRSSVGRSDILDVLQRDQMALSGLNRMAQDLQGIVPAMVPPGPEEAGEEETLTYGLVGESVSVEGKTFSQVRFVSTEHISLGTGPPAGIARIVYYVSSDGEGGFVLRRSDTLDPQEAFEASGRDPILLESLTQLRLIFVDSEGEAHDSWDSGDEDAPSKLPRAVVIEAALGTESTERFYDTTVAIAAYDPDLP
jgi:general secretion pathway protein J